MNSLRVRLALWVLLPLAIALSASVWVTYLNSLHDAQVRQDHRLWMSAQIIASHIQWNDDHQLSVPVPPFALELLASPYHDQAYFSVYTDDGQLLAGWPDLSSLPGLQKSTAGIEPQTARYHGQEVRLFAIRRNFFDSGHSTTVHILVGQTGHQLAADARTGWGPNALREGSILVLVLILMLLGLRHELKPLAALRNAVWNRERSDLQPIRLNDLPQELRPVVDTINQYGARLQQQIDSRRRFIEDAAHQLRTPMALLSTQLHYAARLADSQELKRTIQALGQSRQQITQLVNQLLSLSQAENLRAAESARAMVALDPLAHEVLEALAPLAAGRGIELGLTVSDPQLSLLAYRPAVRDILFNLLDNAIRYTPPGGTAMVSLTREDDGVLMEVEDSGPGIPPELRARVFERFNRGNTQEPGGTGLGLAVVREAALACGGHVSLHGGSHGKGLRVRVLFATTTE
ncbi:MAG TPA: sensor histidine kinase [Castellaniella sp.]|uniref:sensor histidine kinase n=1 Tax=Castellaniella sp. TaxID=1955812 RepID=UPI002EE79F85